MSEITIIKSFQRLNFQLWPRSLEILFEAWGNQNFSEQFLKELVDKVTLIMEEGQYDDSIFIEEQVVKESLKLLNLNQN